VIRVISQVKQAAVHFWVEGLDPSAQDLRKPCELCDFDIRN
jgi:hypothetical protein